MKKILSFICPVLAVILISSTAIGEEFDYTIKQYDVNVNFKKDNTVDIVETIDASFNTNRNGISRKLNLKDQYNTNNISKDLKYVETNDIHIISEKNDNKIIKIVDTQKRESNNKKYTFNYGLSYNSNLYTPDFNCNIIDGTWERTIDKVNFKISLPDKTLKRKKIEFISSTSGLIDNENLTYTITDNTIEGSYEKPVAPHEILTLHIIPDKKSRLSTKQNKLILNNVKYEDIVVYENDEILIRLNSNPSTGFVWQLSAESEDDEDIISISEEQYTAVRTKLCGSGGISEFKVKALKKGKATITGIYIRPWMKYEDTSANKVQYKIEVKNPKEH